MNIDRKILFIFFLALLLRFSFFFTFIYKHPLRAFYTIDAYTYEFPAITLLEKGKYINDCPKKIPDWFPQQCIPSNQPEIYRPPVYPLYIAAHYILFGYRSEIVIFTQNFIDSLKVFLIYHISQALGLSNPYIGALLYAISPSAIVFTQSLMTETMQGFILLIFIMLIFRVSIGYVRSALLGISAALLSLTHPLWYFFALLSPFFVLVYSRNFKKFLIVGFFVLLTIAPWMIRNWLIWKQIIFRHGSHVFSCEIYQKMEKRKWLGDYRDIEIFNEASERFGWGVKFNTLEELMSYQTSLTQELQVAKICREKIVKNISKYPFEIHIAGFLKSFPPIGVAMLYYVISGDINPSRVETAKQIVPLILRGKILEAFKEIRERRLGLLPLPWVFVYLLSWILRISSFILSFAALVKIKPRFSLFLFFILAYGTFLIMTFDAGQPRRFHTVEPIVFILASSVFSRQKKEEIKT